MSFGLHGYGKPLSSKFARMLIDKGGFDTIAKLEQKLM
jgi:hypothetical protein